MTSVFKIGDKVRRIGLDNGVDGARIGTIATVTWVDGDGFIGVYYPGCFDDEDGSEVWHPRFAELFQEPRHDNEKDKEEPVTTVDLHDAYLALQEASGIKAGDTVRVLRKSVDGEMGWGNSWKSPEMDKHIGETGIVDWCEGTTGFSVGFSNGDAWSFPFFVLEKIAAPRSITINGFDVPEPVREPLKKGEKYWAVMSDYTCLYLDYTWHGDDFDRLWLRRGLIHRTQEAAEKHAQALLSFTENTGIDGNPVETKATDEPWTMEAKL